MTIQKTHELITRDEGQHSTRIEAQSTWHRLVKNKLLPSGIHMSTNTVRYLKSEIDTVKAARIAGYSNLEIKELVLELEKNRLINAQELLIKLTLKVSDDSNENLIIQQSSKKEAHIEGSL